MPEKVVLAYSGGLDTSIIIPWLKENYAYDVIAMVGDVGQGDDIEAVVEKAYKTGASKVVVEDLREEFLTGYVFPALRLARYTNTNICLGHRWRVRLSPSIRSKSLCAKARLPWLTDAQAKETIRCVSS